MISTEKGNEMIAKYLGWFQEPDHKDNWFLTDDCSKYVVYSIHNNYPHMDLPFHRDFNQLMAVVVKIAAEKPYENDILIEYYVGEVIATIGDETQPTYLGKHEPIEIIWLAVVRYLERKV